MDLRQEGDKTIIELQGKLTNPYSIIFSFLFILLIILIAYFVFHWYSNPIVAMGASFLPLVLLVFLFKIIIWNFLGKETLVLGKTDLRVFYDYKIIYNKVIKNYNFKSCTIHCISNVTGDSILIEDINGDEKGIFRLKFTFDNKESYLTAMSVEKGELLKIKSLVRP